MERRPEPEVMDDPEQARAYARADFAAPNQAFADRYRALFPRALAGPLLDLGTGPADVAVRLCRASPRLRVVGVDASLPMLAHARRAVGAAGLAGRVALLCGRLPGLPLADESFAAVVSNSVLHHLPDPAELWSEVRRLGRPGAPVLVVDLFRPPTEDAARAIVRAAAVSDDPLLERDFLASLCAAFTQDEVRAQVRAAGLGSFEVEVVSERHVAVWGRVPGLC